MVFAIIGSFSGKAQEVKFGIRLDPQLNWFSATGDIVENTHNRFGFNGGLVIDKYFAENYAFSTGLSLSTAGAGVTYTDSLQLTFSSESRDIPGATKLTYKLQYLEVPLGIKLRTREFGYTTFFAQMGLTAQINVKSRVESKSLFSKELDASDEINLLDMGYHFGGGIEYSLGGNTAIAVGLIFKNGFTDVTKLSADKVTLNTLSLRIGVMF